MNVVMHELFNTDIGLLSLFTLGFMIAMGLFIWIMLSKKAHEKD